MSNKISIAVLLTLQLVAFNGKSQGVRFEHVQGWKQVLAKAKASNKYIFVDCYTTWCGPCKQMSKLIFPLSSVGAFMNDHFVSVQVQMDSSKADDQRTRGWYQEAHRLSQQYHVAAYPSFLVFGPDGKLLHRFIGAKLDSSLFLVSLQQAMDPDHQYYVLQARYNKTKDAALIPRLVQSATEAQESPDAISGDFIRQLQNPFTKENLEIIENITKKVSDHGYKLFLNNREKIDSVLGEVAAENVLKAILWNEYIPALAEKKPEEIDWVAEERKIDSVSTDELANETIASAKYNYYGSKHIWKPYSSSLLDYLNVYGRSLQPFLMNNLIWDAFLHSSDTIELKGFLPWSEFSFQEHPNFTSGMDTYANLLYKLGRTGEAIAWEKKAIVIAKQKNDNEQVKYFNETVNKMERGIITWE